MAGSQCAGPACGKGGDGKKRELGFAGFLKIFLRASLHKKTDAVWHPFVSQVAEPEILFSSFGRSGGGSAGVAPADFVALGSGTQLALLALGRCFKCAAAAHFFEDALGIEFRL